MISKNFLPIINRPTRVTLHSCTLINNIFFNRVVEVGSCGVITRNISDHYPVFAREKFPTLPGDSISINYRDFSDEILSNFKNSLTDIYWNPVLINDDADEAYDLFQSCRTLPYFLFLMNTSPSGLNIFLVVGKVNLGLLLG